MSKPWEKYQQQAASQNQNLKPWEKYQQQASAQDAQPTNNKEEMGLDIPAGNQSIELADYAKEFTGGALTGTGTAISGIGDAVRQSPLDRETYELPGGKEFTPLSNRIGSMLDPITQPIANAIDVPASAIGGWISGKGKQISDSKTDAAKLLMEKSTPGGDILSPSTWSAGDDPSLTGYGLHMANLSGQFAPQAAALYATRGKTSQTPAMMGVGGLQAGGSAADEVTERIEQTPDQDLLATSTLYKELRETMSEDAARNLLTKEARNAAFGGAAPIGAFGGLITQAALARYRKQLAVVLGKDLQEVSLLMRRLKACKKSLRQPRREQRPIRRLAKIRM